MKTKARYNLYTITSINADGYHISLHYIWDEEEKKIVKTHHLKDVLEVSLKILTK